MQNPKHQTQILHRYLQLLNQPDKEMRFSVKNGQLLKHLITVLCTEGVKILLILDTLTVQSIEDLFVVETFAKNAVYLGG